MSKTQSTHTQFDGTNGRVAGYAQQPVTEMVEELLTANPELVVEDADDDPVHVRLDQLSTDAGQPVIDYTTHVGVEPDEDVYVCGTITVPNSGKGHVFYNQRVMLEAPYESKEAVKATGRLADADPRWNGGQWHIKPDNFESALTTLFAEGESVVVRATVLADLFGVTVTAENGDDRTACPAQDCSFEGSHQQVCAHVGGHAAAGDDSHQELDLARSA